MGAAGSSANLNVQDIAAQVKDTVIADPLSTNATAANNCATGSGGSIASQGFNLADDATCSLSNPNDRPVADPGLAPLVGLSPKVMPIAPTPRPRQDPCRLVRDGHGRTRYGAASGGKLRDRRL